METRKRHRLGSATHRLMESYKDDYPSHAKGVLQEAIQNSVDARLLPDRFRDVAITIHYDSERRILRIRDYGTTGMPHCEKCDWGTRLDTGEDCHEKDCAWGNFHYLGGLAKKTHQLGYRGQGKSLAIVAGEGLVVRTKVANSKDGDVTMSSRWTREGDDWFWEIDPKEAMKPTESPGTELIIHGIKDEVHEELLGHESIKEDISQTWFKVLEEGVRIRFGCDAQKLLKIRSLGFPTPDRGEAGRPVKRHRKSIPISVQRKVVGELVDVGMFLAPEPVPEGMRGIALVKNGTQVIERLTNWGRKIPLELQDRLYGWATYHCNDDRPFLQVCEKPGHRGYTPHIYFRKVRDLLQKQIEDFLQPFAEQLYKPRLTKKDRKRARQNLRIIQRVLEEIPEFNPWSGEGPVPQSPEPRSTLDHPYISSIDLDKEYYEIGDSAHVNVVILNPLEEYQRFIHLTIEALDEGLSQLAVRELPSEDLPFLGPATEIKKGRISTEIEVPISEDFGIGRNWIKCTLLTRPPSGYTNNSQESVGERLLDRGAHSLWVGSEPERLKRERSGGGSSGGHRRKGTLENLVPITAEPLDPIEHEIIPMWPNAEIWFYTRGARICGVYESDPRTADSILYELIAEAISDRILELRMEEDVRESLEKSQVLDEFRQIDELRKTFLRRCEAFRSGASV